MLLKIPILLMCWFLIQPHLAAKFCVKKYVNGKWITKGDCGGQERMSALQKQLKIRAADEKEKKRIADRKWTVFQRRKYGNVDFFRGWADYVNGFGNRAGDFWLGLKTLHEMTKGGTMELKIKMITKTKGIYWVAKYSSFSIGPGSDFYPLHVSGFSGNATGDGLSYHNNAQFSTKDADHDWSTANCASNQGGWWQRWCGSYARYHNYAPTNLNGYFNKTNRRGIWWGSASNLLRFSEMKIRKRP